MADDMRVLRGVEGIRERPAMYIGDTNVRGLHHLIEEVVANSVDEAVIGVCENIAVRLNLDGSVSISDDGRGIPVDIHAEEGKPGVEVILTMIHAGAKFDHNSYKVSAGLHGVGVTCVNALSEWLEVDVRRDGKLHHQEYERGIPTTELKVLGKAKGTGTKITFKPDPEIFEVTEFSYETIATRCRELAFLNAGLRIKVSDERSEREDSFHYKGGLAAFVKHLNEGRDPLHKKVVHFRREEGEVAIELALQYTDAYSETILSFANNVHTHDGGTHVSGLRSALTRTFNNYARAQKLLKSDKAPQGEDIREGITAVLSVLLPDPQFEAQSKNKLNNPSIEGLVESTVNAELGTFLEENPSVAKAIAKKAVQAAAAREAARKARELTRRKGVLSSGSLPLKLADCSSKNVETTELFIVEGQSAGGNAKQCRDSTFQAILPLQGKILNVEKARIDKMLNYEQISTLISALGTGIGADDFNPDNARYGKIIIMTDADVDGLHIRTLLLTFFFRHMRELIERGQVLIAQPPLFGVTRRSKTTYYLDEDNFRRAMLESGTEGVTVACPARDAELTGARLRELVEQLAKVQNVARILARHGVAFRDVLETWRETKRLPLFRITAGDDVRLAYSQEEADAIREQAQQQAGHELEVDTDTETPDREAGADFKIVELHEVADLGKAIERIERTAFSMADYFPPEIIDEEGPGVVEVRTNGAVAKLWALSDVPGTVTKIAQKNMGEVQRYKGLGEMNPDQLAETAMSPTSRGLLRVTIEDAAEANRLFTLLMGDKVAPRRQFIEEHALEVGELDI
jgi:DNA gyrase subunit B